MCVTLSQHLIQIFLTTLFQLFPLSQPMAVAPGLPQKLVVPSVPDSGLVPVPASDFVLSTTVIEAINEKCKVNKCYF